VIWAVVHAVSKHHWVIAQDMRAHWGFALHAPVTASIATVSAALSLSLCLSFWCFFLFGPLFGPAAGFAA